MKTIIFIIIFCFTLYKTGALRALLTRCTLENEKPAGAEPAPPELTDREKLEMQARYIITRQGQNPDTAHYMSEGLLQSIINDYIKAAGGDQL